MKTKNPSAVTSALRGRITNIAVLAGIAAPIAMQASTDYGPAIWKWPACNYSTSGYGHSFCVIHDMEGYYASSMSYLSHCSTSASIHYGVNGKKDTSTDNPAGEIAQGVREAYYAWHVRCWNHYMWGTEHEGFASNPAWYTDAMYNATIGLQTHLMNKNGKPKDRNHVIGHNQKTYSGWNSWIYANYAFSPTCNSHSDPGPYWNWTRLMNGIKGTASTPSAPSTLAVAVVSSTSLKLTWKDNSSIETGTKIERSTSSTSGFTQIATVGANVVTYTAGSLASGTKYYFRVRAYNAAGNSGYSNTGSGTTKDTIPAGPTSLTATATSSSQINLAWVCAAGNEDGFKIYRSTDGTTFAQVATAGINATTYSNTGLVGNTKYYYKVYSYNTAGNSAASPVASDTTAPQAPSALTATAAGSTSTTYDKINLSWTDNANSEVGFKIERSLDNVTYTQIATNAASDTTFTDSGLAAQKLYYYRVRSYNANGNSTYTAVASATTGNAPPILTAIGDKSVAANGTLAFTAVATDPNKVVTTTTFATFEGTADGTMEQMFNKPANSATTLANIDTTATNYSMVRTAGMPAGGGGTHAVKVGWTFKSTAPANYWVRLNSFTTPTWPNPTIALDQIVRFKIYSTKAIKVGVGVRETSTSAAYGADGGTTGVIEWAGVTNVVSGDPIASHLVPATNWTTVSLNLPFEPQAAFTGDGKILQTGAKGVLEEIILQGAGGTGAYTVWIDDIAVVAQNTLAYSLDAGAPAGATIERRTGKFSWTPTSAQAGLWPITVRVTDQGGAVDTETIKVTVLGTGNNPPSLAAIGAKTVKEGTALTFTASATDVDAGQTKTFSLDAGAPAGATITSAGVFSWTPTEAQGPGSYPITVRVTDNGSPASNDFETITVTVTEVNTAPVIATIADQTVNEGSTVTVTATATDSDIPANTKSYSLDPGAPAGMTINSSTGVITWTPGESAGPDVVPVTVRATDNGSPILSSTKTFNITINEGNVAPVLTLGTSMSTITPIDDFEGQDVEADNGSILVRPPVYSSTTVGFLDAAPNLTEIVNQTNPYPDVDINTSAQVLHTAFSFKTGTTNPWIRLTTYTTTAYTNLYADPNPTIDLSQRVSLKVWSDKAIKLCLGVRETGTAAPIGFDGGTTGTIEYVGVSGKQANGCPIPTKSIAASNWTTVEFNLPVEGKAALSGDGILTGTKGTLENISIVPNGGMGAYNVYFDDITSVSISTNLIVDTGATITVANSATDADVPAQGLQFSLGAGAPTNAVIDADTGLFTWTPAPDQSPSTNAIPIVVTDDGTPALSDTKNLIVVVRKVNTPPRLGGVPDQAVEVSSGDTIAFTATGEDDDVPGDTLTFSMSGAPAGATLNTTTGDFSWTPTVTSSTNVFTIRVTDNGSPVLWEERTVTIRVAPPNAAPTLALSAATVTEGFANFETFTNSTPTEYVMFKKPMNSSTTTNYIDTTATNYTTVVSSFPAGNPNASGKVMKIGWSFKTGQVDQWVRLTTGNTTALPNPTIDLRHSLKFDIYTTKAIKLGVGVRESGTTAAIGADGGTTGSIEYVGCSTKNGTTPVPTRTINASNWTTVTFNLPSEPMQTLTGDAILAAAKGTLEHLILYGAGGSGAYTVYVDNFQVVYNYSLGSPITMNAGSTLAFTASGTDADPGAGLGFGLGADDPSTAVIDADTGVFNWTPDVSFAGTSNSLTVTVEDSPTNGGIAKSASQTFSVSVVADPVGALSAGSTGTSVTWDSVSGKTYQVQSKNSDGSWSNVGSAVTASGASSSTSVSTGAEYRVIEVADAGSAE
jgi:N-acetyl-anhydromuramyl-L-alanine amidase AmpD